MKDLKIETWLKSFDVAFTYHDQLPLASILIDDATKAQIRMTEVVDDDLVQRYALALEAKADFPGVVVFPLPDAKKSKGKNGERAYGLIGGWHRTLAYGLADRTTIPAYVCDVHDALMVSVLRRTSNNMEGKAPTTEERLEHAVWLTKQGYSQVDAARFMLITGKRLGDRLLFDSVRTELAPHGLALDELRLPMGAVARIAKLRSALMVPVVLLSHQARLSNDNMLELIRQVRSAGSDEEAKKVLTTWRERFKPDIQASKTGEVRPPASPLRRLPLVLATAERLMGQRDRNITGLQPEHLRDLIRSCESAIVALRATIRDAKEVLDARA